MTTYIPARLSFPPFPRVRFVINHAVRYEDGSHAAMVKLMSVR